MFCFWIKSNLLTLELSSVSDFESSLVLVSVLVQMFYIFEPGVRTCPVLRLSPTFFNLNQLLLELVLMMITFKLRKEKQPLRFL